LAIGACAAPNSKINRNSSTTADATLVSNGTSIFGGIIRDSLGVGTRKTGLTVNGGVLTLNNANTYSGNTNVTAGRLVLGTGGSLGNTALTVASGATFAPNPGTGVVSSAGTLSLENGSILNMTDGGIGVLNLTGAGTAFMAGSEAGPGATLNFELSSVGADRIAVSNAAAVTGVNTIGITVLGLTLTPSSTYTLISASSGLGGTFQFSNGSQQTSILVGTTTYRLVLGNTGTAETVSIEAGALSTWAGPGSTTNTTVWNTGTNWSGGVVPGAIGTTTNTDTVVFNANPTNRAPVVDASRNVQNIIFDTANVGLVSLGGSTLTLTSGGAIQTTSSVINSQTVSAPLALQGDYRFASGAASTATLNLTGPLSNAALATLTLGGANTGANTISGQISDGLAPLSILKADTGRWALTSAANSFTGPVTISAGTLGVSTIGNGTEPSSLGASSNLPENLVFNGGTLQYTGATATSDRSFTANSAGATVEVTGADATFTFSGPGVGAGGFTKTGPGKLILGAVNTYAGNTSVAGGTLQIGDNNINNSPGVGNFAVSAGATLAFSRNVDNVAFLNQSISGAGDVMFMGQSRGYFTWRGNYGGALTYTGRTIVNYDPDSGGTWFERGFWLEKDNLLPHATVLELRSGKVFLRANEAAGETISGLVGSTDTFITTDQGTVQRLTVDVPTGQSHTFHGVIGIDNSVAPIQGINAGNISLTKNGAGKQVLASANTYSSTTTVNAGTLVVSGSISGTGATVNNGGTLASGVTGTIQTAPSGNVSVTNGGVLAPGDVGATGTLSLDLSVGGKLAFVAGSTLKFDLGTTSDLISFLSADDWLNGTGNVTLALSGAINYAQTYTIFQNVTTPGFTLAGVTGHDAANFIPKFLQSGNDYQLSFAVVPEPATAGLLFASFALSLGLGRLRRSKSRA
ncbi:MAG: autotransporter outer rane beta-barrel protein, partial [Chthoniobacter sp.]|nr:autotransporter outer rane beta-barrel protein [Chthoniobacter sp.]